MRRRLLELAPKKRIPTSKNTLRDIIVKTGRQTTNFINSKYPLRLSAAVFGMALLGAQPPIAAHYAMSGTSSDRQAPIAMRQSAGNGTNAPVSEPVAINASVTMASIVDNPLVAPKNATADLVTLKPGSNAQQARIPAAVAAATIDEKNDATNASIENVTLVKAASPASKVVGSVDGSGYPYANAPWPNSTPDPWGMYMRQCVSYAAWKVTATGRTMPYWGGRGNASQWDDNARAAGIPVSSQPSVGSIAVDNAQNHVSYVEAVNGDGTITISQYNASWTGSYSVETRSAAGLVYIHF